MMRIEYKLCIDTVIDEDGNVIKAYGIELRKNGSIEEYIVDISTNRDRVSLLINLCNKLNLDPIHIYDVIEDFLL